MVSKKGYRGRKPRRSGKGYSSKGKYSASKPTLGKGSIALKSFRSNDPFPPRCFKTMTYSASGQLDLITAGTANFSSSEYAWVLNSVADPFLGTLPGNLNTACYGMTEMAAIYNRYKVNGVLIEVQFFDPSVDGLVLGLLFNNPSNSEVLTGKSIGTVEKRPQGWTSTLANTGSQKMNFKQYFPMNVLGNITKSQFKNDITNWTAATTGSPATIPLMQLCMADSSARNPATPITLYCAFTIRLSYFTEFYARKQYT